MSFATTVHVYKYGASSSILISPPDAILEAMNPCIRKATMPAKVVSNKRKSILELALAAADVHEMSQPDGEPNQSPSELGLAEQTPTASNVKQPTSNFDLTSIEIASIPLPPDAPRTSPSPTISIPSPTLSIPSSPDVQITQIPKRLSPLPPSPSRLSEFKKLRKSCGKSRTPCMYIYLRGSKKGEKCGKPSSLHNTFCSQHNQKSKPPTISPPTTTLIKLRIDRLKKNKRYFFVNNKSESEVILNGNGNRYYLKLPRSMKTPKPLLSRHYLFRKGKVVAWQLAPLCIRSS